MIKIGAVADVIEILDNEYEGVYDKGNRGVATIEFKGGDVAAFVGKSGATAYGWHVYKNSFKKVGRLKVRKVKGGNS